MHLTVITIPSSSNRSDQLRSETIMISVPTYRQMIISLCTFMVCCCCYCCAARDSITTGQNISDNGSDYLESPGKKFQMGFFSRGEASEVRRYVGIWYTMDPRTVVWVANRDTPVLDSTGFLTVSKDGSVKLLNGSQAQFFITDTALAEGDTLRALKLEDTGNAVLIDLASKLKLWKSFDHPTDTFLPGMMMSASVSLKSWKSLEDPESGTFVFQLDPGTNRYCIYDGSEQFYWKSGSMSTNSFDDNQISTQALSLMFNTEKKQNISIVNKTVHDYIKIEPYSRLVMDHTGHIQFFSWSNRLKRWVLDWQEPKDDCSKYSVCGLFGMCTQNNASTFQCSCLHGFEPISPDEYQAHDYSSGCKRTSEIICQRTNDTFLNKTMISMDDTSLPFLKAENESTCIKKCLENCTCVAYSYSSPNMGGILDASRKAAQGGCWFWDSKEFKPYNLRENGSHNISFRVPEESIIYSSSGNLKPENEKRVLATVIFVTVLVISTFCGISYISYKRMVNRSENNDHDVEFQSNYTRRRITELLNLDHSKEEDREGIDVPYFELESIIAATDNFLEKNRLGQGGFGPVYKGKLPGGKEIAVKRLSSLSGQGLQEFKNEVMLIAKLQHRNLVRLVGYCIIGEEKMLIYEYMPNRSLDNFIFDRTLCTSLDWAMRFNIIMGIAKGLNYLHHDSRLRVIHRDLKTSNILLDEDMNPKISDFGLAKIVKGKDMEATTDRVIGTFGYMSPEYALDGLFSVKSDVFSFGVVMLEIVSGKRNIGFYQSRRSISLLGHAWNLWKEDKPLELMDQILMESCNTSEVLKCIIVGLLCVQGDPDDRPNMTNVILMLGGDIVTLPTPKEPASIPGRDYAASSSSSSSKTDTQSKNMLTITRLDGR